MPKMPKQSKKKVSVSKDTPQEIRHLGVLIESTNDRVQLIAEQTSQIISEIKGIKETQVSHTEMIAKLMVDMAITKEDIEFIKQGFKKKIDIEEFAALERRVALLERKR